MKNGHTVQATCVVGARRTKSTRAAEARFFVYVALFLGIAAKISMIAAGQQARRTSKKEYSSKAIKT